MRRAFQLEPETMTERVRQFAHCGEENKADFFLNPVSSHPLKRYDGYNQKVRTSSEN
jgi:hypothetical protein